MTFYAVDRHGLHVVAPADVTQPDGQVAWTGEHFRREPPPAPLLLRNRLRAALWWLSLVCALLMRRRWPFGLAYALPSIGRRGPWSQRSPMVFGGVIDVGASCCCCGPNDPPLRRLARYAPCPDGSTRVRVRRSGWVAQSRHEPELYGPVADGWGGSRA